MQSEMNFTGLPSNVAQMIRDRLERILRLRPALGPAEVRHENQPPAAIDHALDRRQRLRDPPIIGDFAAIERHIKIAAHQHALALYIHIGNGFLRHRDSSLNFERGC